MRWCSRCAASNRVRVPGRTAPTWSRRSRERRRRWLRLGLGLQRAPRSAVTAATDWNGTTTTRSAMADPPATTISRPNVGHTTGTRPNGSARQASIDGGSERRVRRRGRESAGGGAGARDRAAHGAAVSVSSQRLVHGESELVRQGCEPRQHIPELVVLLVARALADGARQFADFLGQPCDRRRDGTRRVSLAVCPSHQLLELIEAHAGNVPTASHGARRATDAWRTFPAWLPIILVMSLTPDEQTCTDHV